MYIDFKCAICEHVIIVSNTIKTPSIFISLVPVPFLFPDSGLPVFHAFSRRWHALYLFSGQAIPRMLQGEILVLYRTFVSLRGHISASIEKFGSQL